MLMKRVLGRRPWRETDDVLPGEDYVEEAWRIVDPVLKAGTPVYEYEPKQLGARAKSIRKSLARPEAGRKPDRGQANRDRRCSYKD